MKKRGRELNIFSMSALDLFASALGAFILITVVLFPYFPNTGDSPERVAVIKKQLEAAENELNDSQADLQQCEKDVSKLAGELTKVKIPDLDITIVLDITGSMDEQIDGLKGEIRGLVTVLNKLAPTVGIGIVTFGDAGYQKPTSVFPVREVAKSRANFNRLKKFIDSIETGMGKGSGDNNNNGEATDLGLKQAVSMTWRSESERKYIIVITDDHVTEGKEQHAFNLAKQFASKKNHYVSTVQIDSDADVRSFLENLAKYGRGEFVRTGGSIIATVLLAILN
jgi:hypothetical protein